MSYSYTDLGNGFIVDQFDEMVAIRWRPILKGPNGAYAGEWSWRPVTSAGGDHYDVDREAPLPAEIEAFIRENGL